VPLGTDMLGGGGMLQAKVLCSLTKQARRHAMGVCQRIRQCPWTFYVDAAEQEVLWMVCCKRSLSLTMQPMYVCLIPAAPSSNHLPRASRNPVSAWAWLAGRWRDGELVNCNAAGAGICRGGRPPSVQQSIRPITVARAGRSGGALREARGLHGGWHRIVPSRLFPCQRRHRR
jgi:hypothetical protein